MNRRLIADRAGLVLLFVGPTGPGTPNGLGGF